MNRYIIDGTKGDRYGKPLWDAMLRSDVQNSLGRHFYEIVRARHTSVPTLFINVACGSGFPLPDSSRCFADMLCLLPAFWRFSCVDLAYCSLHVFPFISITFISNEGHLLKKNTHTQKNMSLRIRLPKHFSAKHIWGIFWKIAKHILGQFLKNC